MARSMLCLEVGIKLVFICHHPRREKGEWFMTTKYIFLVLLVLTLLFVYAAQLMSGGAHA